MNTNVLGVIIAIVALITMMVCDNPKSVAETTIDATTVITVKDILDSKKQEVYSVALGVIDNLNSVRELEKYTEIEIEATCRKYLNTYQCSKSAMIYALLKDAKLTATRN